MLPTERPLTSACQSFTKMGFISPTPRYGTFCGDRRWCAHPWLCTSPHWGEVGGRRPPGEGVTAVRNKSARRFPSPPPPPKGEGEPKRHAPGQLGPSQLAVVPDRGEPAAPA